jgi:hypothetical protein
MWGGGVLGWAGGFLGGAIVGYTLETRTGPDEYTNDWEGVGGALLGGLVGSTVLTPVLAHHAGGGEGDLLIGLAASVVSGAAMVAVVAASDGKLFLALPLGQIWASVFAENRTAQRSRARR